MKKTKNTCLDENISIIILIIILLGLVLLAGTMNEKIVEGIKQSYMPSAPETKCNIKLGMIYDHAGYPNNNSDT